MKYHPYWPIRRETLKPEDLPRRIQFCTWIFNQAKMANFKRSLLPLVYFYEPLVGFNRSEMLQRFQKCTNFKKFNHSDRFFGTPCIFYGWKITGMPLLRRKKGVSSLYSLKRPRKPFSNNERV